jgi:hypothetical protein
MLLPNLKASLGDVHLAAPEIKRYASYATIFSQG